MFFLKTLIFSLTLTLLLITLLPLNFIALVSSQPLENHVYYGYIPPSPDIPYNNASYGVDEVINGKVVTYTVPSGYSLLDVVGYQDNTKVELYDLTSGKLLNSTTLNKMQKVTFFIKDGTYFKLVTSARVGAMISGGDYGVDTGAYSGFATFYPAVDGGFRGNEFIFVAATGTHEYAYSKDLIGYNFFLFAFKDTDWKLADAIGKFSTSDSLKQRGISYTILQSRVAHNAITAGAGYDVVFHLTSTSDVEVSSAALGQVVYVPSITGGYVGKLFYAPDHATYQQTGRSVVLVIVPLEAGKVTIYDKGLNVLAEHEFTDADVSANNYWFKSFGLGRFEFIIKSTGNITVMAAQTYGNVSEDYIGDGTTFLGSRPNQELKFFTPSSAVLFSSENQTITLDGETKVAKKDDIFLLGEGVHTVESTGHTIIQILAPGTGWHKWGNYLIESLDVDKSFSDIPELTTQPTPYLTYVAIGVGVLVLLALVYFFILRKKK